VESDINEAFKANMDKDYDLLDPIIIQSAKRLNMSVTQAKEIAAGMGLSLRQMFGIEEVPRGQISLQYVLRGPLISPEAEAGLSRHMRNLLNWYKVHIKKKNMKQYFTEDVREEHHFKPYLIHIQLDKLFQLFNQCALDKSIIACYCL
jgi:hypothetical protein